MSNSENSDSPQVKLIREWGGAFEKIDMDAVAKTLHKDYRHTIYPRSIGRPEQNREEWLKHIAGLSSLWTKVEVSYIFVSTRIPFAAADDPSQ